jgi:hypothetical protein
VGLRVFLAGKASDKLDEASEKYKWWLADIYSSTWWSWDHPIFDDIKSF